MFKKLPQILIAVTIVRHRMQTRRTCPIHSERFDDVVMIFVNMPGTMQQLDRSTHQAYPQQDMLKISPRPTARVFPPNPRARLCPALNRTQHVPQQTRTFLDSLLRTGLGECPLRNLSHTKTIPKPSTAVFKAVADVSGYPAFLPFTIASNVTSRDANGYPTRAKIRIGYEKFGLEENWDSTVSCDPEKGTIEAKANELGSEGMFEVLKAKWNIRDDGHDQTLVKLDVDVKFRNALYDQMFAQVEGKVASSMVSAFEKRIQELGPGQ